MVPLFQIFGPSLVPLLSKTGPLFGPSEGLFEGGTRLVITAEVIVALKTARTKKVQSAKIDEILMVVTVREHLPLVIGVWV